MVKYQSNKREVQKELNDAKKRTLQAMGKAGKNYVKAMAPVDTGDLRDSIDDQVDDDSVLIGSTLTSEDYPIYQEKGTSRTPAQPYLHPGIHNNLNSLKKIAERNYRL